MWLGFLFMPATLIVGIECAVFPSRFTKPVQDSIALRTIEGFLIAAVVRHIFQADPSARPPGLFGAVDDFVAVSPGPETLTVFFAAR